jgi:hypothetical protein
MTRITITLSEEEKTALQVLSANEFRDPHSQAALIIRKELELSGLIKPPFPRKEYQPIGEPAGK